MILFFDTETTGLPDKRMPLDHECQPHIVQIAALLCDDDGTERSAINLIVSPRQGSNPVPIPDGAARVHGITSEVAHRCGIYPNGALGIWDRMAQAANLIVAHNCAFDWEMIQIAWVRHNPTAHTKVPALADRIKAPRFCTMEAATPILNLPPTERMIAAGLFYKPKPPKLEECVQFFFHEPLANAHDALADVRACARVYFHIKGMEQPA